MEKLEYRFKKFISRKQNWYEFYIKDGFVCCCGDVIITDKDLVDGHLPFDFGKVDGYFYFYNCDSLTSIKGSPKEVGGDFRCIKCTSLTSLKGSPQEVGGNFYCIDCTSLTSLEGATQKVGVDFICHKCNSLTSVK